MPCEGLWKRTCPSEYLCHRLRSRRNHLIREFVVDSGMGALSWVRFARRLPGVVRQRELTNLEALLDLEAERQPTRNLYISSIAVPAVTATFSGLSVFGAWVSGTRGLPLALGTVFGLALTAATWFIFYRLYQAIPPSKRRLRDLIIKFSQRYGSFENIILGEKVLPEEFALLLDEAAGIYLLHGYGEGRSTPVVADKAVPAKAVLAIEDAMSKLLEVAQLKDPASQRQALVWANPLLEEMRLLSRSLEEHALAAKREDQANPLNSLRLARAELDNSTTAIQELNQHMGS